MQKNIRFVKKPRLVNPVLVVAWPGMGEVALRSATFLVENLKGEPFAYFDSADYFYPAASKINNGIIDTKGLPQNYFYYWKNPATKSGAKTAKHDLIIFLSSAQPDLNKAEDYSSNILEIARIYRVKTVVSFAAVPGPIDHTQDCGIWCAASSKELLRYLEKFNLKAMSKGEISGLNGLFLGLAKKNGFPGFCLLGEIPLYAMQISNPKASLAILEKLRKILHLPLDLSELERQARNIEAEIDKIVDYLKEGVSAHPAGPSPISEAEIEKIKKSLTHLTRLPQSIKERIEQLFESAGREIAKANELKQELDNWGVYKEYEDRFLDLFKKTKDSDN